MKIYLMVLALIMSFSSFAGKDSKDEKQKGDFLKKELNLSDEQLAKVMELKKGHKKEMKEKKTELQELKTSFQDAMKDSKTSNEELTAKFEAHQKARDEFQRKRFSLMLKMREILTPEQIAKFQQVREKFHKKFDKKERIKKRKMKDK